MRGLPLEVGIAARALAGERESGDRHVLCPFPGGVLVGVLDGLGHGQEAFEASRLACATLEEHAQESVSSLFALCHQRLRSARGVVMSLASFRNEEATMAWAGIGNVDGTLLRGDLNACPSREFLLQKAGVVGVQAPALDVAVLPIAPGDVLVLTTDGIRGLVLETVRPDLPSQQVANQVLRRHQTGKDDALVLVARYLGKAA
jgi:phosphoserine phosphatase RsbX